jgi:hypothetical protein
VSSSSFTRKTTPLAEPRKHVRSVMRTTNSRKRKSSCLAFRSTTKRRIRSFARNTGCNLTLSPTPKSRSSKSTVCGSRRACTVKSIWASIARHS